MCQLEAGEVYYLAAGCYDNSIGTYSVKVEKLSGLISLQANDTDTLKVEFGEAFTLSVIPEVDGEAELTFQWYGYNENTYSYELISGATEQSYTCQEGITTSTYFECTASDSIGNELSIAFRVFVENLTVAQERAYYSIVPGQLANLQVSATVKKGSIHYQWYKWEEDEYGALNVSVLTEETTSVYAAANAGEYVCEVTDDYGLTEEIHFYVEVENLTVNVDHTEYTMNPGGQVVLQVQVSAVQGPIYYRWYKYNKDTYEYVILPDETTASYTATDQGRYRCEITDDYGSFEEVQFYVRVDNLTVIADQTEYIMELGKPVVLQVQGSVKMGEIHYQWYKWDDEDGYIVLSGATASSYMAIDAGEYRCVVTDDYGSEDERDFFVELDNLMIEKGPSEYSIDLGGQVVLYIQATVKTGSIHYQWYKYDDDYERVALSGETGSIYTATEYGKFECRITDDYGTVRYRSFTVRIDNEFIAEAVGELQRKANVNEAVELSVRASCRSGSLSYDWYSSQAGDTAGSGSSYTFRPLNAGLHYVSCTVNDEFGNSDTISFKVLTVGEIQELILNEPYSVTMYENESIVFSFTAPRSGVYTFTSTGRDDPMAYLYNGDWEQLKADNDDGEGFIFKIQYRLELNEEYYVIVKPSIESVFCNVLVTAPESLNVHDYTLLVGQKVRIPASADGDPLADFRLESGNSVAVSGGVIEAKSAGNSEVRATGNGNEGISVITVVDESPFTLPSALENIGTDAFAGVSGIRYLKLGAAFETLPAGTFGDSELEQIIVMGEDTVLENGSLGGNPIILCREGSSAEDYAAENNLPYLYIAD